MPETYKGYKGRVLKPSGIPVRTIGTEEEVDVDTMPITPERLMQRPVVQDQVSTTPIAEKEESFGESALGRGLLMGATPMLVSLLAGGGLGPGAEIGGKALVEGELRREKAGQESLADFIKNRREAKKGQKFKTQLVPYEDEVTGETLYARYDEDAKTFIPVGLEGEEGAVTKGYKPTKVTSPATGEDYLMSGSGKIKQEISGIPQAIKFDKPDGSIINVPPAQVKYVQKVREKFKNRTKNWNSNLKEFGDAASLVSNVKAGSLGSKVALRKIMRTVETRISDQDAKYYAAPWSLWTALQRQIEAQKGDKIPENLKQEVIQVLRTLEKKTIEKLENESKEDVSSVVTSVGVDEDYARSVISPFKHKPTKIPKKKEPKYKNVKDMTVEELQKELRGE